MKTKLFILSVLVLVLLAGVASADMVFSPVSISRTVNTGATSVTIDFVLNHTTAGGNYSNLTWNGTSSTGTWSLPTATSLNVGESKSLSATLSGIPSTFTGTITANIHVTNAGSPNADLPITIIVQSTQENWEDDFCLFEDGVSGNPGDLRVKIDDITVTGFGDDADWFPLDEIEVTLLVENRGEDDIDNVAVEWGLYDTQNDEWIIDVDEEDELDLKDGDEEELVFTFKIDDKDLEVDIEDLEDGDNYVLYARATGDVDNTANDATCKAHTRNINLVIEKDFVVLNDLEIPSAISCGSTVQFSGEAWNVGSRDQDSVTARVSVRDLNINQVVDLGDINSLDSNSFDFSLEIPSDAQKKSYTMIVEIYDEDNDIFVADHDDEESRSNLVFSVDSCSSNGGSSSDDDAVVSASVVSGGNAGKDLVVKTTITNTGKDSASYTFNAAGYAGWSSLSDMSPSTLTLASGKSGDVVLTFAVNKDSSGEQTFDLEVLSDNKLVVSQPISVTITKPSNSLSNLFGDSWYIWAIVLANVVLLVLIIVIAVRISRKK